MSDHTPTMKTATPLERARLKLGCLRLELPKSVADDALPEIDAWLRKVPLLEAVAKAAEKAKKLLNTVRSRDGKPPAHIAIQCGATADYIGNLLAELHQAEAAVAPQET